MTGELILIVEDNDKNRKLVRDVLTFKGYDLIETETAKRVSVWLESGARAWS